MGSPINQQRQKLQNPHNTNNPGALIFFPRTTSQTLVIPEARTSNSSSPLWLSCTLLIALVFSFQDSSCTLRQVYLDVH